MASLPIEQNLAILFYSETNNPRGLPGSWPAAVVELGSSEIPPLGWVNIMTTSDYYAYLAAHQSEYDTWEALNVEDPVEVIRLAQKALIQEIIA